MVAKITSPHSIKRALNYNEKKVQSGQATCIYAGNFLKDLEKMNFYDKLQRFQNLISLNERAKKSNTLHISLNFPPSEKLKENTLCAISNEYMTMIGFGEQPYLVYEHQDAGHPHIHIVTTSIRSSGERINTYNIGKLKSEMARREIEKKFGLIRAIDGIRSKNEKIDIRKVEYGKSETKRTIANVLDKALDHYNYTSLASLNAILKTFNVEADAGKEGGRVRRHKGLLYHILDEKSRRVGVPIKASSIYNKPILTYLEQLFNKNELSRFFPAKELRFTIDQELRNKPANLDEFISKLNQQSVDTILRQNNDGLIYGITFVDHKNKCVFNGIQLGKGYSIAALQKRFNYKKVNQSTINDQSIKKPISLKNCIHLISNKSSVSPLKELLQPEIDDPKLIYPLLAKRRKKKRRTSL
ncbi:MAG TPA: relaxase/mobilization nuclease domain-containing protein [Puia sp.]|nr:relaxase/mobilization nuclease domain-containing protein [Puia sp.]